jgi:Glycosyltransferase like family
LIAFGCPITRPEDYERFAAPGLRLARDPDSEILANSSAGSIFRAYNLLLDLAAEYENLEALVLVHQDVEIVDRDLCAKVREVFADPDVGAAGCVGALDARSMAWWEGSVTWASFTHRYYELGGGALPAFAMHPENVPPPPYARTGDVDTLDGFLLVLSPWAVRNTRFDETLGQFHGYDFDLCMQVRAAGRKVVTADLKVVHHHSLELCSDPENWINAHMRLAEKWDGRIPGVGQAPGDWKERARRAEATASAEQMQRVSTTMKRDARIRQLERELNEIERSASWRLTAPLRRLNAARRRRTQSRG